MQSNERHIYRPEIDGLRALAVLPVLLFHFDIPGFDGGFVGVDIFFVISGFLIGGILWSELVTTNKIALGRFFMRRLRRLAPAYFAMAIVSTVFAFFILLPLDFVEYARELIASTVYLSNVHFFRLAGYFDGSAHEKILLHTWSLSVEEQFYIFLPFFMLLLRPVRRALPVIFLVLLVVSLIGCIWMTSYSQTAAFYLFPFRAWELLVGVSLAVMGRQYGLSWNVHPALSWAGLALIAGSVIFIQSGESFPGMFAIAPVAGAALIIGNGQNRNPVNQALSRQPLLFFGLISYSLYLWHWPVATLSKYYSGGDQSLMERGILIALCIVLAWLSLRLVEAPIRHGSFSTRRLLVGAALASVVTLGAGGAIYVQQGMPDRFAPEVHPHIAASDDFLQDWRRCTTPGDGPLAGLNICPIGPEGVPKLLIWGDSHVRAFKEGLEQIAWERDVPALIIWRGGCPPLLGIAKDESTSTRAQDQACERANAQVGAALEVLESVETLLLIGRWAYYAQGAGVGRDAQNTIELSATGDGALTGEPATSQAALFEAAFDHSIGVYKGAIDNVFVLRQVPEIFDYGALYTARGLAHGHIANGPEVRALATTYLSDLAPRNRAAEAALRKISQAGDAHVIDSWPEFCQGASCSAFSGDEISYFDNNHITNTAARRVRGLFAPAFDAARAGP